MKKTLDNPDSQEREYIRLLTKYVAKLKRDAVKLLFPEISKIYGEFKSEIKKDGWSDSLAEIILLLLRLAGLESDVVISRLANQFEAVSKFNDRQFKAVFKANTGIDIPDVLDLPGSRLGVNVFRSEPYLKPLADGWIKENTSLIKSIPVKTYPEIEGIINRGVINGLSINDIKKSILDRFDVAERSARLIARDQTFKLYSRLTRYRAQSVGIDDYTWRDAGDNKVRPEHAARDGKQYSFDDPPPGGNPGEDYNCRCRAELIFEGYDFFEK